MVSTIKAPAFFFFFKDCTFRVIIKMYTCILPGLYYMITPLWQASSFKDRMECLWKAIEVMRQKGREPRGWSEFCKVKGWGHLGNMNNLNQGLHSSFLSIFNLANSLFIEYTWKRVLFHFSVNFTISIREEKWEKCLSSTNPTVQWTNTVECSEG